jgi:hypothetical protein
MALSLDSFTRRDNPVPATDRPQRVTDQSVLQWARNLGTCEWCGQQTPTEPSHTKSRGSGGSDSYLNITALCRPDHNSHHQGHRPTKTDLMLTAVRREAYGRDRAAILASLAPAISSCLSDQQTAETSATTSDAHPSTG